MKKTLFAILVVLLSALCMADTPQRSYIEKYSDLAVEEMYRAGVPASITLAQGLLESGNGLSELAVKGNNHFGIKCHNTWTGAKVYHDDDRKGECFRKYDNPEESFRDHSDFLRYRDRYKFLFDYEPTDYKSWAYGLKAAGYATDPKYPEKLIRLIEEHELYLYDTMQAVSGEEVAQQIPQSPSDSLSHVRCTLRTVCLLSMPRKERHTRALPGHTDCSVRRSLSSTTSRRMQSFFPER